MAKDVGAETIDFERVDSVIDTLKYMTGNRGPDSCMDAVGMEASGHSLLFIIDRTKQALQTAGFPAQVRHNGIPIVFR
jgi:threonine dehydrogenase-like Zn-dependent dehydrogenase